jgi:hypothetical protein
MDIAEGDRLEDQEIERAGKQVGLIGHRVISWGVMSMASYTD